MWPMCHIFGAHLPRQVAKRPGRRGELRALTKSGLELKLQNACGRGLTDRFLVDPKNESSRSIVRSDPLDLPRAAPCITTTFVIMTSVALHYIITPAQVVGKHSSFN